MGIINDKIIEQMVIKAIEKNIPVDYPFCNVEKAHRDVARAVMNVYDEMMKELNKVQFKVDYGDGGVLK